MIRNLHSRCVGHGWRIGHFIVFNLKLNSEQKQLKGSVSFLHTFFSGRWRSRFGMRIYWSRRLLPSYVASVKHIEYIIIPKPILSLENQTVNTDCAMQTVDPTNPIIPHHLASIELPLKDTIRIDNHASFIIRDDMAIINPTLSKVALSYSVHSIPSSITARNQLWLCFSYVGKSKDTNDDIKNQPSWITSDVQTIPFDDL